MRGPTTVLLSALTPLIAAALILGGYLNYASVRAAHGEIVAERLQVVAERISRDAEVALSLGLPLAGQVALDRAIAREMAADPRLGTVDVTDSSGRVLFSADGDRVGREQPALSKALNRSASILTAFGTEEGRVVAAADETAIAADLRVVETKILVASLAATLLATALTIAVVFWSMTKLRRALKRDSTLPEGEAGLPAPVAAALRAVQLEEDAIAARLTKAGLPVHRSDAASLSL